MMTEANGDDLLFLEEPAEVGISSESPVLDYFSQPWKILIVDDDEEVHRVTRWVLRGLRFESRPIEFISAYSAGEAQNKISEVPDAAVILLDVVMEDDNAGLRLAHYIRRTMGNQMIRIILRTGHPGQAPEQNVMLDYDINDYKEKTELTSLKLQTAILSSLRSYRDLCIIDNNRRGLQKIVDSLASIHEIQSMIRFASGILTQLTSLLRLNPSAMYINLSGFAATLNYVGGFQILSASGEFENLAGKCLEGNISETVKNLVTEAYKARHSIYHNNRFVVYFCSKHGSEGIVYMEGMGPLSEWDRDIIEVFCMNVSIAFDNIQLNLEIEDTQKEILFTLGEIAEARSHETGRHVKRVAEYSKVLALKYGLPSEEAELVRLATPIHDVGKLGIPDIILNKPGKLTPEEFEIIKTHSTIGYEMLKTSQRHILQTGALIALQHHEKWDGSGYPDGLQGDQIHLYGRIVALADVFDALGNDRVYKKAWPMDEVVAHISSQRGKHFDPVLVDIFLEHLEEFLKISRAFPDTEHAPDR